jgi:NAD(P)-dependent dehydrogenase (short-subunit alcohol dehydrogenase family)
MILDASSSSAAESAVDNGWLTPLVEGLETVLRYIQTGFDRYHVPYSYGWSIVTLTLFVKTLTFPLTKTQVESTMSMQALKPEIDAIKDKYGDDKDAVRSIVTMSSANAVTAIPAITGYNAAKGGVNNLTRNMALSLAPHGIRVNAVAPGSIMTEMLSKVASDESVMKGILMRTPLSRVGDPSEVASVIDFLGSKASSYMTGQILYCDGGRNALNYVVDVSQESLEAATKAADAFRIGTT